MHTHARQQCTSPRFLSAGDPRQYLSDALPPLSLVEARLAQVSVAKTNKIKLKKLDVNFCDLLFLKVQTYRVQFGILPGTKTSQQVKVPSLSSFPFI